MADKDVAELLEKSITAANRTTHAVRAFVRFLFIQLSFYTAAFMVWQVGLVFIDPSENCTILGCTPNGFFYLLTAVLIVAGIVIASKAGWHELELSRVPKSPLWPADSKIGEWATKLSERFAGKGGSSKNKK
jgi:hypothetical protein